MNDLRKLAEDAARYIHGPWRASKEQDVHEMWPVYATELDDIPWAVPLSAATDGLAELYAAASPDVILGLLDVVDAAREAASMGAVTARRGSVTRLRVALERLDARSSSKVETGVEK